MSLKLRVRRASAMALTLFAVGSGTLLSPSLALADCMSDFGSIRDEMQAKGQALEAAGKRKAPPQELCPLFRAYTAAEAKLSKYLVDNKEWCQIPDQAIQQSQAANKKSADLRDKVCAAAAQGAAGPSGPGKPPPQGSMSSALGVTTGYSAGSNPGGGGVFDTLSGNALRN